MSELKAYIAPTADGTGLADYYLKSEADKVIAEKDKEIERQNTEIEFAVMELKLREQKNDELTIALKEKDEEIAELSHANYKRCLAMAMWCESKVYHIRRTPLCDMPVHEYWQYENDFWQRWHKRWLELAEHFRDLTKKMEVK